MADYKNSPPPEVNDSLMEFIEEYFRGNVHDDFSICEEDGISDEKQPDWTNYGEECIATDGKWEGSGIGTFNYSSASSSADLNSTIEMFPSPNTSSLSFNSPPPPAKSRSLCIERSQRRRSVSYEIRFTNTKEANDKIKIWIVPNQRKSLAPCTFPSAGETFLENNNKAAGASPKGKLLHENFSLRQKVQILEKKLTSLEKESERVVGELKRIIERKNQIISRFELQFAGINFMDHEANRTS